MDYLERFRSLLPRIAAQDPDGLVTPSTLCTAAAESLGVEGAGVTLIERHLRLPLGASSAEVTLAEQVQTTLGDGPCLDAARHQRSSQFDQGEVAFRWPVYHQDLTRRTRFRAVAAVPLVHGGHAFGAMNFYTVDGDWTDHPALSEIDTLAAPVTALLLGAVQVISDLDDWDQGRLRMLLGPRGTAVPNYRRRIEVWTAIGMLMQAAQVSDADALAVLRSYAYGQNRTLDTVSDQLVHRQISTDDVLRLPE